MNHMHQENLYSLQEVSPGVKGVNDRQTQDKHPHLGETMPARRFTLHAFHLQLVGPGSKHESRLQTLHGNEQLVATTQFALLHRNRRADFALGAVPVEDPMMKPTTVFPKAVRTGAVSDALRDDLQVLAERLGEPFAERVREVRDELRRSVPGAGPDEVLLRDFAATSAVTCEILLKLELALARRALDASTDSRACRLVSRTLHEVVRANNAIGRRQREALHASAVLRAQRVLGSGGPNGV